MSNIRLAYVHAFIDRHGRVRRYFRRNGRRLPLPGLPGSAEFMAAYQAAIDGSAMPPTVGARRTGPGTISAMVVGYLGSSAFHRLRPSSQMQYRRILEGLRREHGDKRMAMLERKHVVLMVNAKASTPVAARDFLRCLRLLVAYAISIEVIDEDPTAGVKAVVADTGGHKTWSEADIAAFEARFPIGTKARLALSVLLYTVQRCSRRRQVRAADGA
jgi:hypothetical protein